MGESEQSLTIVIPAFNEAEHVADVLEALRVATVRFAREIIVVDDGSTDDTSEVAARAGARVIVQPRNRGYGAALKTGIRAATTGYVMTLDADGQHRPEDAVRVWESLGEGDMAVGERTKLVHSPLWRMPGKWVLGWMARRLVGREIPDLNCGLRVIRSETARRYLHLCPDGFSFSTTMTMALLCRGYAVKFVPIEVRKRQGTSTVSLRTGFQTLMLVLRIGCLFEPLRFYLPLSALCVVAGILWGAPYVFMAKGLSVGSMLLVVTGVLLFAFGLLCDQISSLRLERYE